MTTIERTAVIAMVLATITALVALTNVSAINAWEKAHGYPYGRMCDIDQSCPAKAVRS